MIATHRRLLQIPLWQLFPGLAVLALALVASRAPAAPIAGGSAVEPPPAEFAAGFEAITEDHAREWLAYLAGPECAGRGTGEPGYFAAARFVAERFKAAGLEPIGDDGYFQLVPFVRSTLVAAESTLTVPGGFVARAGEAFGVSRLGGGEFSFDGPVVFVNAHGEDASMPEGLELDGKALVVVSQDTGRDFDRGLFRRGTGVRISVVDRPVAVEARFAPQSSGDGGAGSGRGPQSPRLELTRAAARGLARLLGVDPTLVDPPTGEGSSVRWQEGDGNIAVHLAVQEEAVGVPNVVGLLRGADPALGNQHIAVGAHLDHLGKRGDVIYPGADDDGSGVTAVLLIADALAHSPVKPARSVLFLAFCGEEIGLIGSRYYTEHPLLPLADMSCLLQMDMVGRNEETDSEPATDNVDTIHLVGSDRLDNPLHDINLDVDRHVGLVFEYDEERVFSRSDHANFARNGVPITFLFSGFHPDYHQPTDTLDKINFAKIVQAARLNYLVLQRVAALAALLGRGERPKAEPTAEPRDG